MDALKIFPEGLAYREAWLVISLMQFRDNMLLAANTEPKDYQHVVEEVRAMLKEAWSNLVRCKCADEEGVCEGMCMGHVCCAMGLYIVPALAGAGKEPNRTCALQ